MKYLYAIQDSVDGREICSAFVDVTKVSEITAEYWDLPETAVLLHGKEELAYGYAPPGAALRLCRWPANKLDSRAIIREL